MGEIVPHNFFRNAENPKMSNRLASTTMIRTAIRRASHQVLDDNPRILDDPLAVGLVEGSSRDEIVSFSTSRIDEAVKELGEPWLTYFTSEELSDHLQKLGFSDIAVLTPENASTRDFVNRCDRLRAPNYGGLIRASCD
jgi:O-methyltransferase involved in polyketide biosynthesis